MTFLVTSAVANHDFLLTSAVANHDFLVTSAVTNHDFLVTSAVTNYDFLVTSAVECCCSNLKPPYSFKMFLSNFIRLISYE